MCSASRSDDLSDQYADLDYHHEIDDQTIYAETKPLLEQHNVIQYIPQPAAPDFVTFNVMPSSAGVLYDNAPGTSHATYSQLQPL